MDVQTEGCSHYLHPLPNYMPLAPQIRHALFWQIPSSHYCWEPPSALSTRSAFLFGKCTTGSNLTGTRERALDHRVPLHWPDPSHQGVPGGGAPVAGDTPNLPLGPPGVLTSQIHYLAPSHPARSVGAAGELNLSWNPFLGYPQMTRGPPLSKGYTPI